MSASYQKAVYTLTAGNWTAVVAPIYCNYFWIFSNSGQVVLEDTTGTGAHVDTINPYFMQFLQMPVQGSQPRFQSGETITYLSCSAPTISATVAFIL